MITSCVIIVGATKMATPISMPSEASPNPYLPSVHLTDVAADQRRQGGAQVDAHVEDREPAVPLGAPLGIERPDDRRDVRLEETVAADQQRQAREEGGRVLEHQHRWPAHINRPPKTTARREPKMRSASMPPKNGVMYTSAV